MATCRAQSPRCCLIHQDRRMGKGSGGGASWGGPKKRAGAREVGEKGFWDQLWARNPKFLRSFLYPLSFTLLTLSQALTHGLRERVQDSLASRWVILIFGTGSPLSYMTPPNESYSCFPNNIRNLLSKIIKNATL